MAVNKVKTIAALQAPRYIRLPPQKTTCPYSGLSRGKLNELILPTKRNPIPPVKSIKLPNRGKGKKGVRLVVLESLMAYLQELELVQNRLPARASKASPALVEN